MRIIACFLALVCTRTTFAQPTPAAEPVAPASAPAAADAPHLTLGGYAEAYAQWNFNRPGNGLTNYRAFDNRHATFTLSNVVLDAQVDAHDVVLRLALQVGHTPSSYYAAEPDSPGSSGANASDAALWKYVQQAYGGYRFHPFDRELTVLAGLFLSPFGPESLAIRDNWTWSYSNLYYATPFYHTGARASLSLSTAWTVTLALYNGWNSVVDNNREKSLAVSATFTPNPQLTVSALYFGGVERADHAPEGQPLRHAFDVHATVRPSSWLELLAHTDLGFESNRFGTSYWTAGQLAARFALHPELALVGRVDAFHEHVAENDTGRAAALFWPAAWVSSQTVTLDYHPNPHLACRLEYRHDQAQGPLYYRGASEGEVAPRARSQNTVTAGVAAGF